MFLSFTSGGLVLVIPEHRLPELHLVPVRIHDPCELSVFIRLGASDDFDPIRAQLRYQLVKVVNAVVDHERRVTWAEPLAVFSCDTPHSEPLVFGLVIRPSQDRTTKAL